MGNIIDARTRFDSAREARYLRIAEACIRARTDHIVSSFQRLMDMPESTRFAAFYDVPKQEKLNVPKNEL